LRYRELSIESNSFWSQSLITFDELNVDPRTALDYSAIVDEVTSDNIKAATKQYFSKQRYVLGVLNPEKTAEVAKTE